MTRALIPVLILSLILPGCLAEQKEVDVISFHPSGYEVKVYTPKENKKEGKEYLNALVEWKNKSNQSDPVKLIQKTSYTNNLPKTVQDYPAMLIQKNGETIELISGKTTRHDILEQIQHHMEQS
ncbi:hypothetical protein [Thalassobacillus sp. CUG 92003]|uniref:hypothetical protein n=1 Tax=Thalassobacillus sp. CUG 92003 TaxID=2736641 RepID=UPI0015E7DB0B|nr:hypothetical protein [Thalassobacillus sp. CUG 92003]